MINKKIINFNWGFSLAVWFFFRVEAVPGSIPGSPLFYLGKLHVFLKNVQELRIKNNVKEYFLRLRFYTYINRNTDILKILKRINNDNIKIPLNKKEINEKKYKDLLGDKWYKEYYFDINDKVINITKEDIIYGCKNLVKNKATSWYLIPGKLIKSALKK